MQFKGADVSVYQGVIDFTRVKNELSFVIVRGGYGKNNIDKYAKRNLTECNRVGLACGLYWFSYAYTPEMAKREAEYAVALAKQYRLEFPICFDWEYDSDRWAKKQGVTVGKVLYNQMVEAFCHRVEELGYYAMVYANNDYYKRYLTAETLKKYDLWYAFPDRTKPDSIASKAHLWQTSFKGRVNGISGNVDLDVASIDFPKIIRRAKLNHLE